MNVYIQLALLPDDPALATANRRVGLSLPPPEYIPR